MAACPGCATENRAGARFCNGCGARLAAASVPVREERKVVTVLFADLAGFTARSEVLDPEDVRAFLVPYYEVLRSEITRHGGIVERYLGDGVMALFGAPTAHEDDPERAIRAALRILERIPGLGLDLHVRLGINTGPVLFAAGDAAERDDAVTGDAVNTAARLQAFAPVDGVVVGETTYRATAHLFVYEALATALVKGKAEPLGVWRPSAPIARPVGDLHADMTPFVGRDLELALLAGLFERSRWTPSVELATVVAQPGMGKSRLVRELARHLDALPHLVTWRTGRWAGDPAGIDDLRAALVSALEQQDTALATTHYLNLTWALCGQDPSAAVGVAEEGISSAASRGVSLPMARAIRQWPLLPLGRWDEIVSEGGELVRLAEPFGHRWMAGYAAGPLAMVLTRRGRVGEAADLARTASSETTSTFFDLPRIVAHRTGGQRRDAVRLLEGVAAAAATDGIGSQNVAYCDLAREAVALRRPDLARRLLTSPGGDLAATSRRSVTRG